MKYHHGPGLATRASVLSLLLLCAFGYSSHAEYTHTLKRDVVRSISLPDDASLGPSWFFGPMAFSPDGQRLAFAPSENFSGNSGYEHLKKPIYILAFPSLQYEAELNLVRPTKERVGSGVDAVLFSPDGKWLICGDDDGSGFYRNTRITVWDVEKQRQETSVIATDQNGLIAGTLAISRDGKWLAALRDDNSVLSLHLWGLNLPSVSSPQIIHLSTPNVSTHGMETPTIVFSADMKSLFVVVAACALNQYQHFKGVIEHISIPDGRVLSSRPLATWGDHSTWSVAAMSPDGRWMAGSAWNTVALLSMPDLDDAGSFVGHGGYVHLVAFSPDSRWLLSLGNNVDNLAYAESQAKVWSVPQRKLQATIAVERWDGAAICPNGERFVLTHGHEIHLYSLTPTTHKEAGASNASSGVTVGYIPERSEALASLKALLVIPIGALLGALLVKLAAGCLSGLVAKPSYWRAYGTYLLTSITAIICGVSLPMLLESVLKTKLPSPVVMLIMAIGVVAWPFIYGGLLKAHDANRIGFKNGVLVSLIMLCLNGLLFLGVKAAGIFP